MKTQLAPRTVVTASWASSITQQPMPRLKNGRTCNKMCKYINSACFTGRSRALLPFPPSAHQYVPLPGERPSLRENLRAAEPPSANVPCHRRRGPPLCRTGTEAGWMARRLCRVGQQWPPLIGPLGAEVAWMWIGWGRVNLIPPSLQQALI